MNGGFDRFWKVVGESDEFCLMSQLDAVLEIQLEQSMHQINLWKLIAAAVNLNESSLIGYHLISLVGAPFKKLAHHPSFIFLANQFGLCSLKNNSPLLIRYNLL